METEGWPFSLGGVPPFCDEWRGAAIGPHSPPHPWTKNDVKKNWGKIFYISPMKKTRLRMKEWDTVRFDLCVIAACVIAAAVIMGLYNLFS
jgi:hypothetical protein